jgi:hypothetical protein
MATLINSEATKRCNFDYTPRVRLGRRNVQQIHGLLDLHIMYLVLLGLDKVGQMYNTSMVCLIHKWCV